MKTLMIVTMPHHTFNAAVKSGTAGAKMKKIMDAQKPEAAYFFAQDGKRGGIVVLDLKDASQIPAIAEPWFLAFNASVECCPAMNAEDFARAIPGIEAAVKKYGSRARAASA